MAPPASDAGSSSLPPVGNAIIGQALSTDSASPPTIPFASDWNTRQSLPPFRSLQDFIQHLCDRLPAEIAVAFRDLETGREFLFNERQMMHAASTMKVPVMIEVFRQAEANHSTPSSSTSPTTLPRFRLEDSLLVKNEFKSIVDGSIYRMDIGEDSEESLYSFIGKKLTIGQLVEQMITVSSNLATNLLVDLIGVENIMRTLHTLGITNMKIRRGVEDIKAYRLGLNNQTDAMAMLLTLQAIAEKRAASPTACETMLAMLKRQKFRDGIPAGLPQTLEVAHKTGSIVGIAHDCAIVFPKTVTPHTSKVHATARKPYLLVVLTSGLQDNIQANRVIAEISGKIYREMVLLT
ncbi:MAG: class A beta-lactamase-related serine hydrolase [candidate division KSB1 bacterium]|nr:class A beta-lactamase-related serine hydrolase [candidate division KSB1 bacterium]